MSDGAGFDFLQGTKYQTMGPSDEDQGLPQPALELPFSCEAEKTNLPDPADLEMPPADLRRMIEDRVSVRRYSSQPLTLEELSFLLWCTQGVKSVTRRPVTMRTVPSAGARHAFETYVLVNRVVGLTPGLYRYLALEHKLLALNHAADLQDRLTNACWRQAMVGHSAVTFFWTAVSYRMRWRYGERGFRYIFLDAGHVCQNLYLAAEAIGCGSCAIAAFDDDALNNVLNLDGIDHFAVYAAATGKRIPPK